MGLAPVCSGQPYDPILSNTERSFVLIKNEEKFTFKCNLNSNNPHMSKFNLHTGTEL